MSDGLVKINGVCCLHLNVKRGLVTKQTVPPRQPVPVSLEIYRNTHVT